MCVPLNPEELCSLIDDHFSTLLLYARQWDADCADDLVQDAFLQLVRRSRWEGRPPQPLAWLFQVVRNGAIDRSRKKKTAQKHEESFAVEKTPVRFETPENAIIQADEIESLLAVLPQEQREIVVERIWGGLSFDEIAALHKTSRTTIFRTYTEAIAVMKRKHQKGNEK
jgi:RNA polymerase sigma-70 factor (ECF subfamily)